MKEKKYSLLELKKDYKKFQEKYNLPSFERLNEDFGIEKAVEVETDLLLREIRKIISDKLYNYLRFIESILNPVNVHIFIYSIIKSIGKQEKEKFSEIYKKLAQMEITLFEIEVFYSEKKEAEFIKDSYKLWQEIKKDVQEITEVIKKNWDVSKFESNDKKYFG